MSEPTAEELEAIAKAREEAGYQKFAGYLKRFAEENGEKETEDPPKKTTPPARSFFSDLFGG